MNTTFDGMYQRVLKYNYNDTVVELVSGVSAVNFIPKKKRKQG